MADISIRYAGLELKSPIIVASCGLTADAGKVKAAELAGAGAVVVKSLFEEQIISESSHLVSQGHDFAESSDYVHYFVRQNSIANYCSLVRKLKQTVSIPVIGSINCYTAGEWTSFAKDIENAGADAIELNIYSISLNRLKTSAEIEDMNTDMVRKVVSSVSIPVIVKISSSFTSLPNFVDRLKSAGASAVVMFNRFYMPDIDIDRMQIVPSDPLSSDNEYVKELRSVAIVSSLVRNIDIAASTGIGRPETAVKELLAGASAVQLCSVLYRSGMGVISEFNSFLSSFMDSKGFSTVADLKGLMNYSGIEHPDLFERTQFMKVFGERK